MKSKTKLNIGNIVLYIMLTCFIGLMIESQLLINEIKAQIKNDVVIATDQSAIN